MVQSRIRTPCAVLRLVGEVFASRSSIVRTGPARVLVVDDDDATRISLAAALRREGFSVDQACDGIRALRLLEQSEYDAVVLDIMLPRVSGYEVLDRLLTTTPRARTFIIVTTTIDDVYSGLLRPEGVQVVIRKPFDVEMLAALMRDDFGSDNEASN
jgi:DNA-binding response OmpR family regulator